MRQVMNEQIEDEKGLMSKQDFKTMFYTSFGRSNASNKGVVYQMLLPIIQAQEEDFEAGGVKISGNSFSDFVSIAKLGNFIDFFNYFPFMMSCIKHKNDSSGDLYLYMGKPKLDHKPKV